MLIIDGDDDDDEFVCTTCSFSWRDSWILVDQHMPVTPSLLGSAAAAAAAAVRSGAAAASAGYAPRDDRPRPPRASGRSRGAE